jgi:hypothetical protein
MQLLLVPTPTKSQLSAFTLPGDGPVAPFKVVFPASVVLVSRTVTAILVLLLVLVNSHMSISLSKSPWVRKNAALHQGLGLTALPYAHDIIHHAQVGLVEELRMNQKRFGDFEQILQSYNDGACVLPASQDPVTGVYVAPYERS